MSQVLVIIPARYDSSRFPGKPLAIINGKSMIQRVYEQAQKASLVNEVIVATDDQRIFDHVRSFGGKVEMTDKNHKSGTDRCAEVSQRHFQASVIVNVQGDEPYIHPEDIDKVIEPLLKPNGVDISTLATPILQTKDIDNPNVVKVVFTPSKQALYFSRSPLPYLRNIASDRRLNHHTFHKHLGIYGFRQTALFVLTSLPQSPLEKAESLEQLRWLEAGYKIHVEVTENDSIGVDTPEDLERLTV